jgi:ElaB/YqjD/DUF883 family membrane-anchored ribosome-binding protein
MAYESEDPEVIRQQMEAQRAALTDKLETLECKIAQTVQGAREAVSETVQEAKEAVAETVQSVKDTVHSSVETVKETFDVRRQVQRHPWAMLGGSVAAGFVAGMLLNRTGGGPSRGFAPAMPTGTNRLREHARTSGGYLNTPATTTTPPQRQESWVDELAQKFAPEIQKVKGFALGAAMGLVRDLVSPSVPEAMRPQFTELLDNVTTKLGGEPVQGDVLNQLMPRREEHPNGHHNAPREEARY